MTKPELLSLMRLLAALESAMLCTNRDVRAIPDYLLEQLADSVAVLEREILKGSDVG